MEDAITAAAAEGERVARLHREAQGDDDDDADDDSASASAAHPTDSLLKPVVDESLLPLDATAKEILHMLDRAMEFRRRQLEPQAKAAVGEHMAKALVELVFEYASFV